MTEELWNRLDENSIPARREEGIFTLAIYLVINVIIYFILSFFDWPIWIVWIPVAFMVLSIPYEVFLAPKWKYETTRYQINETNIQIIEGKIINSKVLIPMRKVQHIELEQGPIVKRYQLMSIIISTAAGTHNISCIDESIAEQICVEINRYAGLYDEQI